MPFNQKLQKFNAKINTVTIGSGDKTVTIGGDSTYPFYSFDAPSENTPKIGVEISDLWVWRILYPKVSKHTMTELPQSAKWLKKQQLWKVQILLLSSLKVEIQTE